MEIKVSNFPLTSDMLELDLFCLRFILQITRGGRDWKKRGGGLKGRRRNFKWLPIYRVPCRIHNIILKSFV